MTTDNRGLAGIGASRDVDIDFQDRNTTGGAASRAVARLVVFAPNWLGDAVLSLPALAEVRQTLPNATIDVAARASIAPLFSLVPRIDQVVTIAKRGLSDALAGKGPYDAALLLTNSFNSARLAWSAGIPQRWGYRADVRSLLLTRAIAPLLRAHQSDVYRHLVHELGFAGRHSDPVLVLPDDRRAAGIALLKTEGWDPGTPLVAVAPGAAFGGAKRWPAESFAAVVDALAADGIRTVVIGTPGDVAAKEVQVAARTAVSPIDVVGRTDLPTLAGVLATCRALVTNDSGAMHFAAALGVPVTAMFGPTRERDTHPLGNGHAVLTNPVWCRPCMLRECPLTHRCMTGIGVNAVLAATRAHL